MIKFERPQISDEALNRAFEAVRARLHKIPRVACVGVHETIGLLAEEFDEVREAARAKFDGGEQVYAELMDCAVLGIFGMASIETMKGK